MDFQHGFSSGRMRAHWTLMGEYRAVLGMGHMCYANAPEAQAQKIITHSMQIQALRYLYTFGYLASQPGH